MSDLLLLSVTQLKRAVNIKEEMAKFEKQLDSLLSAVPATAKPIGAAAPGRRRKMSAAARARIAAAQKARWAKVKGKSTPKPTAKAPAKKHTMSAAARAKIAAAAKARWAKAKAAGKKTL